MSENNLNRFEEGFQDGVYAIPRGKQDPSVKVRTLYEFCKENNVNPGELSEKEMEQFLDRVEPKSNK